MGGLFDGTKNLEDIGEIYDRMGANCPNPSSTSERLWQKRHARKIAPHNTRKETLLEKAAAMLAYNGYMRGWFNQCPTASGITDSSRNRHSNVDLVHWDEIDKQARLVELKWESDDPLSALRQVLGYGAVYVFCRVHENSLPLQKRSLMKARHVSLEVAAPARYYQGCQDLAGTIARMRQSLDKFDVGSRIDGLTMSLNALAFPADFNELPFKNGEEVRLKCDTDYLTREGKIIRDAFNGLTPVF